MYLILKNAPFGMFIVQHQDVLIQLKKILKTYYEGKISHITPRLLIDNYRKASTASTVNTAPASVLVLAANESLMTMAVGLLTTESPTTAATTTTNLNESNTSLTKPSSILRECDEVFLIQQFYQEIEFL